jgi:hypothetical protein
VQQRHKTSAELRNKARVSSVYLITPGSTVHR